jgi:sporadic carbohydrate cluster protein (TIGR04323 family)
VIGVDNRAGFRGYVTSRSFGAYYLPVPVQSLALRDYCQRKGKVYGLPVNENIFPSSYLVLEGLIQNLAGFEGIVMCSFHMLPQRAERRREIYERVLSQGCSLHFVFEDIIVSRAEDVEKLEELITLCQIAARAPKSIPIE